MRTILIADDYSASLELTREILMSRGYVVVTAINGREVLEKIESVCPDLLLLDIQMPVLDGYGVVTNLRKQEKYSNLPIIAASASAMDADKNKALASGFDAYLEKPYNFDEFIELVRRMTCAKLT